MRKRGERAIDLERNHLLRPGQHPRQADERHREPSISFRQIHLEDAGRIRYRKFCELEDREVDSSEIGKGYEDADGTVIPITDEDLAKLPLPTSKTIEILAFLPEDRIDPLQLDTAYYLSVNGTRPPSRTRCCGGAETQWEGGRREIRAAGAGAVGCCAWSAM